VHRIPHTFNTNKRQQASGKCAHDSQPDLTPAPVMMAKFLKQTRAEFSWRVAFFRFSQPVQRR
jgi:hypothetical protein